MMMVQNCILLILCVIGNFLPVSSFAAWMKCYHELEPEEVIMNHYIVPAENVDKTHVQIRVMEDENSRLLPMTRENDYDIIMYEYDDNTSSSHKDDDDEILKTKRKYVFQIGIDIDNDEELRDIQFVVDILTEEGARFVKKNDHTKSNSPTPSYPRSKKTPLIQCKGKRGVGKHRDTRITIEIDDTVPEVEIVAGWACEREAVKLTKRVIFKSKHYLSTPIDEKMDEL